MGRRLTFWQWVQAELRKKAEAEALSRAVNRDERRSFPKGRRTPGGRKVRGF